MVGGLPLPLCVESVGETLQHVGKPLKEYVKGRFYSRGL